MADSDLWLAFACAALTGLLSDPRRPLDEDLTNKADACAAGMVRAYRKRWQA